MISETAFPHPQPSFPFPVDLVESEPGAAPLVCVKFNAHYLPYILGALLQLALRSTWDASTDSDAQNQLLRVNDLIYLFQKASDDCGISQSHVYEELDTMPAFRVDCDCNVFVMCCDGTEIMLAKASDVPNTSTPSDTNKQPLPGGGTAKYCQTMSAQGKFLLPTLVNSGDVITLLSASGAGNDGVEAAWRCVDGSQFFGGACVGFAHTDGADPLPATNHMALIVNIGGAFYSIASGSVTVPGGVSSAEAYIQVNDSALLGNVGSYDICAQVTNNATSEWSHTFDFLAASGGWVLAATGDHTGEWIAGTGWQGQDNGGGGESKSEIDVKVTFPSTTITHFEAHSNKPNCSGGNCLDWGGYTEESNQFWAVAGSPTVGTDVIHSWDGSQVCTLLYLNYNTGTAAGPVVLTKVVVRGVGVNPFA